MSHTKRYQADLYYEHGEATVNVIVNSDWSGHAEVFWSDKDGNHGPVNIPAWVLRAIARGEGKEFAKEAFERLIEELP